MVAGFPEHMVALLTLIVGKGLTTMLVTAVLVQELALVALTVYCVVALGV
jgi:hypothetical protein